MEKDYIYATSPLLEDALTDRHRFLEIHKNLEKSMYSLTVSHMYVQIYADMLQGSFIAKITHRLTLSRAVNMTRTFGID
jgi:hypothetical protein